MRALLTEAIRQRDAFAEAQKRHLNEATEAVHDLGDKLDCALRDVEMWKAKAIRVSGEADALERERDEAQAKLVEEREAMASISGELVQAQVKVAKERDEARAEVKTLRLLVESQTEQISHSAMDLYAAVQAEVKAEQRAERAEALLLAREKHNGQ
jgi:chromosome segregation ATPase